jgi:hypothetical protein
MIGRLFKFFPKLLQSYTGPIIEILVKTIHNPGPSAHASGGVASGGQPGLSSSQHSANQALVPTQSYFLTCNCISGDDSWAVFFLFYFHDFVSVHRVTFCFEFPVIFLLTLSDWVPDPGGDRGDADSEVIASPHHPELPRPVVDVQA